MFRVERSEGGGNWVTMMASPHRIGIEDLRGPPEDHHHNFPPAVTTGNKTAFTGRPGWEARVRYEDSVIERYEWAQVPVNEFDPDSDMIWGWKLIAKFHEVIPPEKLWPLSFVG